MKLFQIFIFLLLANVSFGQKTTVFYDAIYKIPVPKVKVYDSNGAFIGLTNDIGQLRIQDDSFPLEARNFGYAKVQLTSYSDTIFLTPKYQELEEVDIKPVNKMELYESIIERSSLNISKKDSKIRGTYFESVMIVNPKKRDTVFLDNVCDLIIEKEINRKSFDYTFYCSNGARSYVNEGKGMEEFDAHLLEICLGFVKPFKNGLKYDLLSPKEYKLKFEEKQIDRNTETDLHRLSFEKKEGKNTETVEAQYQDWKLYTWSSKNLREKHYDGEGIFVNYRKFARHIEFGDLPEYFFNTMINDGIVQIAVDGKFYEIYVVKGFIADNSVDFETGEAYKEMEDYFETLKYSKREVGFYKFEENK